MATQPPETGLAMDLTSGTSHVNICIESLVVITSELLRHEEGGLS
jgi:hypothetical protein